MKEYGIKCFYSRTEYLEFIDLVCKNLLDGDTYETEQIFGMHIPYDEETDEYTQTILEYDGKITYSPEKFPAVVYYHIEDVSTRYTNDSFRIINYATFEELGIDRR